MEDRKWLDLLKNREDAIIDTLEEAFKKSVDNQDLQLITEINESGDIYTWYSAAGSNSMTLVSFEGRSLILGTFCNQYMDIEITEEDVREYLTEKEIAEIESAVADPDEWCGTFMEYVREWKCYHHAVRAAEEAYLEWYKDEYAYTSACDAYNYQVGHLSQYVYHVEKYSDFCGNKDNCMFG